VGDHEILNVLLIEEFAKLGERHRYLQAEPLAGKFARTFWGDPRFGAGSIIRLYGDGGA
jgi:hypothetical protein